MRSTILTSAAVVLLVSSGAALAQSGAGTGQWSGHGSGQGTGQHSGQGSGQGSGQHSGQGSGQGTGQGSGQGSSHPVVGPVAPTPTGPSYVTLYELPNFGGRQFTYTAASNEVYRQGYRTQSAKSVRGPWTLCDSRNQCQTVDGSASSVGVQVSSVNPGRSGGHVVAGPPNPSIATYVTLYEFPNYGGRQFTYTASSNQVFRQGYRTRSAKTVRGTWTLCDARRQCQFVSGATANITLDVASVERGRVNSAGQGGWQGNRGGYGSWDQGGDQGRPRRGQ